MAEVNDRPIRLFHFLAALSALTREHGVRIPESFDVEFADERTGRYALDPEDALVRWMED